MTLQIFKSHLLPLPVSSPYEASLATRMPVLTVAALVVDVGVVVVGVVTLVAPVARQALGAAETAARVRRARHGLGVTLTRCQQQHTHTHI